MTRKQWVGRTLDALADEQAIGAMSSGELASLRVDLGKIARLLAVRQAAIGERISRVTATLRARGRPDFEVTDHAVVRYLERARGFGIESVRREISGLALAAERETPVKGDAVGLVSGDLTLVVTRERLIVTVVAAGAAE